MTVSQSPLGPHIQLHGLNWTNLFRCNPAPACALLFDSDACREAAALSRETVFLLRPHPDQEGPFPITYAGGRQWIESLADLRGVDFVLGRNMPIGATGTREDAEALDQFHLGMVEALAEANAAHGWSAHGVVGCFGVGNPPDGLWRYMLPGIRAALDMGGLIGIQGYASIDVAHGEEWLMHRGPLHVEPLLRGLGVETHGRWCYTEFGFDGCDDHCGQGEPPNGGWRSLIGREWNGGPITEETIRGQLEVAAHRCVALGVRYAVPFTFWGTEEWHEYDYALSRDMLAWWPIHWSSFQSEPPPTPPPPEPPPGIDVAAIRRDLDGIDALTAHIRELLG